ncbi:MAG: trigger factor, partial [Sphingomonadales bacterium]
DKEYAQIWEQIKMDLVQNGELTADEAKTLTEPKDKADQDDFKNIAERRVRLGLLLAEIGSSNNVTVSQEEINQQIMFEAKRFPGQEKEVFDYYRKNQQAVADVRAPVYEDKVVDLILETAKVTVKKLSTDELKAAFEALENEDEAEEKPAKKAKKAAPKKAAAKKAPAKKAAPQKTAAKKVAAKKK